MARLLSRNRNRKMSPHCSLSEGGRGEWGMERSWTVLLHIVYINVIHVEKYCTSKDRKYITQLCWFDYSIIATPVQVRSILKDHCSKYRLLLCCSVFTSRKGGLRSLVLYSTQHASGRETVAAHWYWQPVVLIKVPAAFVGKYVHAELFFFLSVQKIVQWHIIFQPFTASVGCCQK